MLITKQRTNNREVFLIATVNFISTNYSIDKETAEKMVEEYINQIDVDSPTIQHLGPDYFALQILMIKGVIPYKPM